MSTFLTVLAAIGWAVFAVAVVTKGLTRYERRHPVRRD
ncbi:hypothetical protein PROPHIGD43A-4_54 [Mycobacterium phage prophiGD43A-4]|nr:hypothetical protein PROPHIGD43A-4_54 [Mycobacterium phage prophiGD43A-4]WJJ55808.1 hypothetical protein PROPHIT463_54 [Mycobacterium phage prophiT46-3]